MLGKIHLRLELPEVHQALYQPRRFEFNFSTKSFSLENTVLYSSKLKVISLLLVAWIEFGDSCMADLSKDKLAFMVHVNAVKAVTLYWCLIFSSYVTQYQYWASYFCCFYLFHIIWLPWSFHALDFFNLHQELIHVVLSKPSPRIDKYSLSILSTRKYFSGEHKQLYRSLILFLNVCIYSDS